MKLIRGLFNYIDTLKLNKSIKIIGQHCYFGSNPFILGTEHISIGNHFSAYSNLRIEVISEYENKQYNPKLIIGNHVAFGNNVHIGCINQIQIEDGVLIGSNVIIEDHSHGDTTKVSELMPVKRPLISKGPIHIEKNVWIGDGVCIMPNVTIGENSIIGANAVVTKDVPKNCVVAGIPSKVIRKLD